MITLVDIWKQTRKLQQPMYMNRMLRRYVPDFNEKIYAVVETMNTLVDGPEFDAWDYMPDLSFDIISSKYSYHISSPNLRLFG